MASSVGHEPSVEEKRSSRRDKLADEEAMLSKRSSSSERETKIDEKRARFPFCVVWTPLPMITWLLPFIGHVGLAPSDGKIHDFAGPYHIGIDDMAFGSPTKYWKLTDITDADHYDKCVEEADGIYRQRMHNLCADNCHSHVAQAFNLMAYRGKRNWTMVSVWWHIIKEGQYCKPCCANIAKTYAGFIVLAVVALALSLGLGIGL